MRDRTPTIRINLDDPLDDEAEIITTVFVRIPVDEVPHPPPRMETTMTIARNLAFALAALVGTSACVSHVAVPRDTRDRVLADFARGESLDKLSDTYHLGGRDAARDVVHEALLALQKRYYQDR